MCTDAADVRLNALHEGDDATTTITLEYAAYMNWGRWNHNPSRVTTLIEEFLTSGCSVQLRHVPTETSWEDVVDHGYIAIYDQTGKLVLRRDGFQHNRKLRAGGAYDRTAVKAIVEEVKKAASEADTKAEAVETVKAVPPAQANEGAAAA